MKINVSRSVCLAIEMVRAALAHSSVPRRIQGRWSEYKISTGKMVDKKRSFSMEIWVETIPIIHWGTSLWIEGWVDDTGGEVDIEIQDIDDSVGEKKNYHFLFYINELSQLRILPEMTIVPSKD